MKGGFDVPWPVCFSVTDDKFILLRLANDQFCLLCFTMFHLISMFLDASSE